MFFKKKTFISLFLSINLFFSSIIYAGDFTSSLGISNITPATSGSVNGKTFFTTTSIYYRFSAAASNYEPIYHISPPDMEASCAGINLKGMFVSMLGFDRIAKMLKSAGASFAWGVVVGLIYSLPGIFSAFKMLNAWAKKIQQLMQNSCKLGQSLSKKLGGDSIADSISKSKKDGILSKINSGLDSLTPKGVADKLNDLSKAKKGIFGEMAQWLSSNLADDGDSLTPVPLSKVLKNNTLLASASFGILAPGSAYMYELMDQAYQIGGSTNNNLVAEVGGISDVGEMALAGNTYYKVGQEIIFGSGTSTENTIFMPIDTILNKFYPSSKMEGIIKYIIFSIRTSADTYVTTDYDNLSQYFSGLNEKVKEYKAGSETLTEEKRSKIFKDGNKNQAKTDGHSGDSTQLFIFGRNIGYTFMFPKTISTETSSGAVNSAESNSILKIINQSKNIIKKPSGVYLMMRPGGNDAKTIVFPTPTSPTSVSVNFTKDDFKDIASVITNSTNNKDIPDQITEYITGMLDQGLTPDESSNRSDFPPIFQIFADKIQIYKNSNAETRTDLKESLKTSAKCIYTASVLNMFDKLSQLHYKPNAMFVGGSTIDFKSISVENKDWKKHREALDKFRSGLISGMMSDLVVSDNKTEISDLDSKKALEKYRSCKSLIRATNAAFADAQRKITEASQKIKDNIN